MLFVLRVAVSGAICAAALAVPAVAAAAPPLNDNYLSSTSISDADRPLGREYSDVVDTTEATTQADIFNPNRDGVPFSGGAPELTTCGPTVYGNTAWWDFRPQTAGDVEIRATGGFDVVVAVYEWSSSTSNITRLVTCQNNTSGSETVLLPQVGKGRNYTVQVGGAGPTGGLVFLGLSYFPEAPVPTLALASARLRVPAALRDAYPSSFRGHTRFKRSCYRIAPYKVGCNVRWYKGAFRYTGKVWFRNDLDDPPAIVSTDARVHRKRIRRKPNPQPAPPTRSCDRNYSGCLDPNASDYDCLGGSGDGPRYTGPVRVYGDDHYDLDRDGDGIACDDS